LIDFLLPFQLKSDVEANQYKFMWQGETIREEHTPALFKMADREQIFAILQPVEGLLGNEKQVKSEAVQSVTLIVVAQV
jgi:diphthamide biosynthesis methyltransferase